jgi:hypothetical protein
VFYDGICLCIIIYVHKDTMSELEINLNLLTIYACSDITAIPFMGKSKASYKIPSVFIFSFINGSYKHHH